MNSEYFDLGLKIVGIVILVVVVLFILTWSGVVKCKDISPYWCEFYDMVVGSPRVLIVYSDSGLGDPQKLKTLLQDPRYIGIGAVDVQHVDRISLGNLKKYKLVIVEHARKLSSDQLEMFMQYVNAHGGRLVWVGDSGVEFGEKELREYGDTNGDMIKADNPWFRIKDNDTEFELIKFDEFLGLRYLDNYCAQAKCPENFFSVGVLESESTGDHPLIFGTSPTLNFKIKNERGFSIVKQISESSSSNIILTLNHGGVVDGKTIQIPKFIPLITTSSVGLGERVAYYAYPPEWFFYDNNYLLYVKNMYYGMLGR